MNWKNLFQANFSSQQFQTSHFPNNNIQQYSLHGQNVLPVQQNTTNINARLPFFNSSTLHHDCQLVQSNVNYKTNEYQPFQNFNQNHFYRMPFNNHFQGEKRVLHTFAATATSESVKTFTQIQKPRFSLSQKIDDRNVSKTSDELLVEQFLIKCDKHKFDKKSCKQVYFHEKNSSIEVLKVFYF